jgi:hypothetical protein
MTTKSFSRGDEGEPLSAASMDEQQPTVAMPGGSPIGAAVGAVLEAVTGYPAPFRVPEEVDPAAEDAFWRVHHRDQPFASIRRPFEEYTIAYRLGYTGFKDGKSFAECEEELRAHYEEALENSKILPWAEARAAARAAYERVSRGEAVRYESRISGTNAGL